ncbi:MAG: hypothetical protein GXY85_09165 [Candidatus Brocadiaceae bacterium]|nr:hypothetical protein [Candidatus Brocadiaceae bacterium]
MSGVKGLLAVLGLVAALSGGAAAAEGVVTVAPSPLRAQVMYSDMTNVGSGVFIRVWQVGAKDFLASVRTAEAGMVELPALDVGRYVLVVNDRARVDLHVSRDAKATAEPTRIVIPRGQGTYARLTPAQQVAALTLLAAAGEEGAPAEDGESDSDILAPILIVAGVGAGAGGYAYYRHRRRRVSP